MSKKIKDMIHEIIVENIKSNKVCTEVTHKLCLLFNECGVDTPVFREVYPTGTKCRIEELKLDCTITSISIIDSNVKYELEYYYNGEFKTTWKREGQFTTDGQKAKLGFKQ